jgi:CRP/FNR family cyclic AMP-dependent transcriptional regulator
LHNIQRQAINSMNHAQMTTHSWFSKMINSFNKPKPLSLQNLHITTEQLKNCEYLKNYTLDEFEDLLKHSELIETPSDCTLIKNADQHTACYIILFGAAQVTIIEGDKSAKVAVIGPMNLIGSCYTIDNTPSIFQFTTCERAVLLKISEINLSALYQKNSSVWYKIYDELCKSFVALVKSVDKLNVRLHSESYNR